MIPKPPLARPIFDLFPDLRVRAPFAELGTFPTPVERLSPLESVGSAPIYAKRDDRSSVHYGGNKVRTLEGLFGEALSRGATRIYSTGAYGTNHGLATILHARRVGLEPGLIVFPQPASECALENLRTMLALAPIVHDLPHWSALPFGMIATRRDETNHGRVATIMMPGGATAVGGLGYVNAALELATQIERGELPRPSRIVVGVGSTCTSAGLLVGLRLAASRGLGFTVPPIVHSVRVTPWPVTARFRIVGLAVDIAAHLAALVADPSLAYDADTLGARLETDGSHLGFGYGFPTKEGRATIARFRREFDWELDTTYSAKAASAALAIARTEREPVLFWSTKSTSPLPHANGDSLAAATPRMRRWIAAAERTIAKRRSRGLTPG